MKKDTLTATAPAGSREPGLFLDRLKKAKLDEQGTTFVRRALADRKLHAILDGDAMLELAVTAQQHGLVEESLAIMEQIHQRFPDCRPAWTQHVELLALLGRTKPMIQIRARALVRFPEERFAGPASEAITAADTGDREDIADPFQELRQEERRIGLFMEIFQGKRDAFARQWVDRKEEKQGYVPVHRPLTPSDLAEHLGGRRTYGIYLLDNDSMVRTGVIDMDLVKSLRTAAEIKAHREDIRREALYLHRRIATIAAEAGLCCIAEISGGKGYHFWFPASAPVPAAAMRNCLQQITARIEEDVRCFSLEVFPKQDTITGKGFGNLVKLPLGIHRGTGKPSSFVMAKDRSRAAQFEWLETLKPTDPEIILQMAKIRTGASVLLHPRHAAWAKQYPELARLEQSCSMLGQIMAGLRGSRQLSMREEKILLSTIGHLPRARLLLHHLFEQLPEYNRPLLDYKISRIRGTVLGCKRIHSLLDQRGDLPCRFESQEYPHPLRHLPECADKPEPRPEKIANLEDALTCLKTAIRQVERFM